MEMLRRIDDSIRSTIRARENAFAARDRLNIGSQKRITIEKVIHHLNCLHSVLLKSRREIEEML